MESKTRGAESGGSHSLQGPAGPAHMYTKGEALQKRKHDSIDCIPGLGVRGDGYSITITEDALFFFFGGNV